MTVKNDVDIMMIGHFAKDLLVVDGHGEMASGGAVYYGGIALGRQGLQVAVATRLHPDDSPLLDEFRQEGVRVYASSAGETSGIENIYRSADMERRICRSIGFAGPFRPEDIPDLQAGIYVVASLMAGEVDLPMLKALAQRGPVALDVQGFVRVRDNGDLVFRQWPEMEEGLKCVTFLKVDRAEAELLTGLQDLGAAARELGAYGPREVVVTQMSGVTVFADGELYRVPFTPRSLNGRTGRGDTCFATYLGQRLSRTPIESARFAAAVTTLKLEQAGPWRGSLQDVEALLSAGQMGE